MTKEEIEEILLKHKKWVMDDSDGVRAYLSGANLRGANLSGADLCCADLCGADLRRADLCGANLSGADLCDAYLCGANLRGAYLSGANLRGANLSGADLRRADLCGANLSGADLSGADLCCANLSGANLRGANLRGADLRDAYLCGANLRCANLRGADLSGAYLSGAYIEDRLLNTFYPIACPEYGAFVAWKKAHGKIVKLEVCEDALRCSAFSRKCRCSKAKVLAIENIDGTIAKETKIVSDYDPAFVYRIGEIVEVPNFDTDRKNECAPGIHFFITRKEAVDY